jgi:hypothetical protein
MPVVDGFQVAVEINSVQKNWFPYIRDNHIYGKAKTKLDCPVIAVTAC